MVYADEKQGFSLTLMPSSLYIDPIVGRQEERLTVNKMILMS